MNPELKTITFDTDRIIKSIYHISEVSNIVTAIYHATKNYNVDNIDPLETDGLGFVFTDKEGKSKVDSPAISGWIFKKAFEDFIVGLTQSLIEIYTLLEILDLVKQSKITPLSPQITLEKLLAGISKKANELNFPRLLTAIETRINCNLVYKNEILTINKVRNCMVHRNSIVDNGKPITLRYIDMRIDVHVNGERIEVTKEFKKNRTLVQGMDVQNIIKSLTFGEGSKIVMTPDIFKGVTNTCILFMQEIVRKLPIDENIKKALIPPFQLKVVTE